jgi:hypothetical protein
MSLNTLLNVPTTNAASSISRGASPYKGGISIYSVLVTYHIGKSRAGDPNALPFNEAPDKLMFKELGSGAGVSIIQSNLSKERENERIIN